MHPLFFTLAATVCYEPCTLGPSRDRNVRLQHDLPPTRWLGQPANRYEDAEACTTSSASVLYSEQNAKIVLLTNIRIGLN